MAPPENVTFWLELGIDFVESEAELQGEGTLPFVTLSPENENMVSVLI